MVERLLWEQEVARSNRVAPISSSKGSASDQGFIRNQYTAEILPVKDQFLPLLINRSFSRRRAQVFALNPEMLLPIRDINDLHQ